MKNHRIRKLLRNMKDYTRHVIKHTGNVMVDAARRIKQRPIRSFASILAAASIGFTSIAPSVAYAKRTGRTHVSVATIQTVQTPERYMYQLLKQVPEKYKNSSDIKEYPPKAYAAVYNDGSGIHIIMLPNGYSMDRRTRLKVKDAIFRDYNRRRKNKKLKLKKGEYVLLDIYDYPDVSLGEEKSVNYVPLPIDKKGNKHRGLIPKDVMANAPKPEKSKIAQKKPEEKTQVAEVTKKPEPKQEAKPVPASKPRIKSEAKKKVEVKQEVSKPVVKSKQKHITKKQNKMLKYLAKILKPKEKTKQKPKQKKQASNKPSVPEPKPVPASKPEVKSKVEVKPKVQNQKPEVKSKPQQTPKPEVKPKVEVKPEQPKQVSKSTVVSQEAENLYSLVGGFYRSRNPLAFAKTIAKKDIPEALEVLSILSFMKGGSTSIGTPLKQYQEAFVYLYNKLYGTNYTTKSESVKQLQKRMLDSYLKMPLEAKIAFLESVRNYLNHIVKRYGHYRLGVVSRAISELNKIHSSSSESVVDGMLRKLLNADGYLGHVTMIFIANSSVMDHTKVLRVASNNSVSKQEPKKSNPTVSSNAKPKSKCPKCDKLKQKIAHLKEVIHKLIRLPSPSSKSVEESPYPSSALLGPLNPFIGSQDIESMVASPSSEAILQLSPSAIQNMSMDPDQLSQALNNIVNGVWDKNYYSAVGDPKLAEQAIRNYRKSHDPRDLLVGNLKNSNLSKLGIKDITFETILPLGSVSADLQAFVMKKMLKNGMFDLLGGVNVGGNVYMVTKYSSNGKTEKYLFVPTIGGYVAMDLKFDKSFRLIMDAGLQGNLKKAVSDLSGLDVHGRAAMLFGDKYAVGPYGGVNYHLLSKAPWHSYSAGLMVLNQRFILFAGYERFEDAYRAFNYMTLGASVMVSPRVTLFASGKLDPNTLARAATAGLSVYAGKGVDITVFGSVGDIPDRGINGAFGLRVEYRFK